jgi:hypothetical protein
VIAPPATGVLLSDRNRGSASGAIGCSPLRPYHRSRHRLLPDAWARRKADHPPCANRCHRAGKVEPKLICKQVAGQNRAHAGNPRIFGQSQADSRANDVAELASGALGLDLGVATGVREPGDKP